MNLKPAFFCLFCLCFFAAGCTRKGCTDPSSLTYDAKATLDDGSCVYSADQVLGNFVARDTTYTYNQDGTLAQSVSQNGFVISKISKDKLLLQNYNTCSEVYATASKTSMVITGSKDGCFNGTNFICTIKNNGTMLVYTYNVNNFNPFGADYVKGVATKQP